jgi:hypothetical protein
MVALSAIRWYSKIQIRQCPLGGLKMAGPFISKMRMSELLTTAWEGGSNYWVEVAEYIPPEGMSMKELHAKAWEALPAEEKEFWKTPKGVPLYAMLPFLPPSIKWKVAFKPNEPDGAEVAHLTPDNMRTAVERLGKDYKHIVKNIMEENYDAGDADAWLQMAIFNEVIFG